MTKVLVHGNPETAAVWDALLPALEERGVSDVVRLSPPGFGVPPKLAPTMAKHLDATMGASILDVYRSAVQPALRELGIELTQHRGGRHCSSTRRKTPSFHRNWFSTCRR